MYCFVNVEELSKPKKLNNTFSQLYAIINFDNCGHAYAAVRARVTRSQLRRQLLDSSQTAPRQLPRQLR